MLLRLQWAVIVFGCKEKIHDKSMDKIYQILAVHRHNRKLHKWLPKKGGKC